MSSLIIAGVLVAMAAAFLLIRPVKTGQPRDEALLALQRRKLTLEQLITVTQGDYQRGDIDQAFARDEQSRFEQELLEVMESLSAYDLQPQSLQATSGFPPVIAVALFLLMVVLGGGLYYQHQQDWWQATLNNQVDVEQPMTVAGQPDIGAMVARLASRLAENPNDGEGWKRLGRSYWVLKNYQQSVDAYAQAASLLPDDFTLIQGYAMSRMALMEERKQPIPVALAIDAMVDKLRLRVDANPDDLQGYQAMAAVYIMVSRREAAAQMYERFLQHNPTELAVAISAASNQFILSNGELTEQVKASYERIANLDPDHDSVIWYRGYVAYKTEQWQQVIDHWQPLLDGLRDAGTDQRQIAEALEEARQRLPNEAE